MCVHHGLTGGLSHVYTHVVPVWMEIGVELLAALPDEFKDGRALIRGQREEVRHVTKRDDQYVTFTDGIMIVTGVAEDIPKEDILGGRRTKRAVTVHRHWQ